MILGTGIDLVEVARVAAACTKTGDAFIERVLRPEEWAYCCRHKDPMPCVAARFAAKEAVAKAFGTGIGALLGWQDMEILRRDSGQPYVVFHGRGQQLFNSRGGRALHLSLTHTAYYAAATAILEGE